MRSLFRRTFLAFLAILAVLLLVLGGALVAGYNRSISAWSEHRIRTIEDSARQILAGRPAAEVPLPQDIPVFIYGADEGLVASNRGVGRRRDAEHSDRVPIRTADGIVGYYSVGATAFRNDAANRILLESLLRAAVSGSLAAFAVAAAAAWLFARSLSTPAARVARGIDSIAHGVPSEPIPEQGAEEIGRIARAANTLANRLQSEAHLRTQWAQDVTHDLRTPIASMRAQLEAILDGVYPADPPRIAGTLAELARLESLIGDLEELMRLEAPEVRLESGRFSAGDFARTLVRRFEHEASRKQITLVADTSAQTVQGDEALLFRAASNLLANAVRHAHEGSEVSLRIASGDGNSMAISVHNHGIPIPADELPHLFDRLFRGEYGRTSAGSGLGLTIVRRIAQLHGGEVTVSSDAVQGTTFSIRLPLA